MGIFALLFGVSSSQKILAGQEVLAEQNMIILDVRTPDEFRQTHVKDAINIDIMSSDFQKQIEKLDKSKTYKVYCRSGNRSGQAERIMKSLGFKEVENLGSVSRAAKRLNRICEGKSC